MFSFRAYWKKFCFLLSVEGYSFSVLLRRKKGYSFSSERQSGEKPSLYFFSFAILVICISLSPSIVNSSCKLSKSTSFLKNIFKWNFQVPTSIFKLNIRWCKVCAPISSSGGLFGPASNESKHDTLSLWCDMIGRRGTWKLSDRLS